MQSGGTPNYFNIINVSRRMVLFLGVPLLLDTIDEMLHNQRIMGYHASYCDCGCESPEKEVNKSVLDINQELIRHFKIRRAPVKTANSIWDPKEDNIMYNQTTFNENI